MKPITISVPQYQATLVCLLGWPNEEVRKYLLRKYKYSYTNESDGCCIAFTTRDFVIVTNEWNRSPASLALLGHEVLHACLLMLDSIGQGVSTHDHEHLTYLYQHIFETILLKSRVSK